LGISGTGLRMNRRSRRSWGNFPQSGEKTFARD